MKQTATPPPQTTLDEYENGQQPTDWQRIRDEVLDPFHRGVETILDEVRENGGLREPAIAAIDITPGSSAWITMLLLGGLFTTLTLLYLGTLALVSSRVE